MRPLKSVVELPPPVMAPPPPESVVEVPPELPMLVVEFCLTAAFEIAIRSNQTPTQYYSITFHLTIVTVSQGLEISKEAWNGITDTSLVDNI
ncbi:hypothetical protein LOK49_LG14G00368 [Camellia lanceoleosa]|uniref:Uncharacterized protein n=1 Tax=Camellia lanceoleosa TaxID=1840588 RepID=A0ACC0FDB1_9ERIC|nr:hypothetical protein LOK49_LG14G00368 [Camellia lanceoleosa]